MICQWTKAVTNSSGVGIEPLSFGRVIYSMAICLSRGLLASGKIIIVAVPNETLHRRVDNPTTF